MTLLLYQLCTLYHLYHTFYFGSCPGRCSWQSHSWRGWDAPSALTNTAWIARSCAALSIAAFLCSSLSSSNAPACNGAASSGVNSKYCLWPGWATTRTKNSWIWPALHAGWPPRSAGRMAGAKNWLLIASGTAALSLWLLAMMKGRVCAFFLLLSLYQLNTLYS